MQRIAILIPCYNEELTITKVVRDFKAALPEATVYVYDNNSSDKSAELAEEAGAVVVREPRQGKGNVIRSMFRQIDAECYLMVDADDTYDPAFARALVGEVLDNHADMAVGDRLSTTYFTENKRMFHNFGNKLVRMLVSWLFKSNVRDIMTGYRAFSYDFAKSFPVLSRGFEIETEMTIHALDKNWVIREVAIQYKDRPEGSESKLQTGRDGVRVLKTIFRLFKDYRPLAFFGAFAAVMLLVGAIGFTIVLIRFFETRLVDHMPTLVVSMFLFLGAMLSFICGLILDTLRKQHRQDYELYLNQLEAEKQKTM